jgi:hypothetical protein
MSERGSMTSEQVTEENDKEPKSRLRFRSGSVSSMRGLQLST